jgi:hypothetical protein
MDATVRSSPDSHVGRMCLALVLAVSLLLVAGPPVGSTVDAQPTDGPRVTVNPKGEIRGEGWPDEAAITATIGDPAAPDWEDGPTTAYGGWFALFDDFLLDVGDLVTVTDGDTTKTHEVLPLTVEGDLDTSLVTGTAPPHTSVRVRLTSMGPDRHDVDLVSDGDGTFAVDLAADGISLDDWAAVTAFAYDGDGDATVAFVPHARPSLTVEPQDDLVRGSWFTPRATVEIDVGDVSTNVGVASNGEFWATIDVGIVAGDTVTVTDGDTVVTHLVLPLDIGSIDLRTDEVSGVGMPLLEGAVAVRAAWLHTSRTFVPDGSGAWAADFSTAEGVHPPINIVPGLGIYAYQYDAAGNATAVRATSTGPECLPATAPTFPDVAATNVHAPAISCAAEWGIAQGHGDGTFRPGNGVRRDQMASFIVRTLEASGRHLLLPGDDPANHGFSDVGDSAHAEAIGKLAVAGIVRGTSDTTYSPDRYVRRDQMAAYLVRSVEWARHTTITAPSAPFTDIAGNTHEAAIDAAYDLGLTTGRTPTLYDPATQVRRDQMATFLMRLLDEL